jgi:Family of unknown function (DUF5677)
MTFEFGETTQSEAFFDHNPKFFPAFERIVTLTNKCFARTVAPTNRLDDLCFNLGQTCRQDFLEVIFLAANGYGIASSKVLRGLYERAVTLAYLIKHPEKTEKFIRFAAIQEHKAVNEALKMVSEKDFDEIVAPLKAQEIRKSYEEIKPEFQVTRCGECGAKGTAFSWDIDLASMVREAGEPYSKYYLGAYVIPNLQIHATLASTMSQRPNDEQLAERNRKEGRFALLTATFVFLLVIRSQDALFSLNLGGEIEACEKETADVWQPADQIVEKRGRVNQLELSRLESEYISERDAREFSLGDTLDIKASIILAIGVFLAGQSEHFFQSNINYLATIVQYVSVASLILASVLAVLELWPQAYGTEASPEKYQEWAGKLKIYYSGAENEEALVMNQVIVGRSQRATERVVENIRANKRKSFYLSAAFVFTSISLAANLLTLTIHLFSRAR